MRGRDVPPPRRVGASIFDKSRIVAIAHSARACGVSYVVAVVVLSSPPLLWVGYVVVVVVLSSSPLLWARYVVAVLLSPLVGSLLFGPSCGLAIVRPWSYCSPPSYGLAFPPPVTAAA